MTKTSLHPGKRKADAAAPITTKPRGNLFRDRSLWLLLLANGVTILLAVVQNWNALALMWVYWFQSIAIGFFNFLRLRHLGEFSTEGLTINGRPAKPTQETENFVAQFFLVSYGIVLFIYFLLLLVFSLSGEFGSADGNALNSADLKYILPTALLFLGNHAFSFFYNRMRDTGEQDIVMLMFYPHARVLPMIFAMFLGASLGGGLLLVLLLKTLADAAMHVVEHEIFLR